MQLNIHPSASVLNIFRNIFLSYLILEYTIDWTLNGRTTLTWVGLFAEGLDVIVRAALSDRLVLVAFAHALRAIVVRSGVGFQKDLRRKRHSDCCLHVHKVCGGGGGIRPIELFPPEPIKVHLHPLN